MDMDGMEINSQVHKRQGELKMNNNFLLNGDLPRRRLQVVKDIKSAYKSMSDANLQTELEELLKDIIQIKSQLDKADENRLKFHIDIDQDWYDRAEFALGRKNKLIAFIQRILKERRREAHALQLEACEANKEIKKQRLEIQALRDTLEERAFVKICAERLDRKLYLDIWEEVKTRMSDFNETQKEK